jgi:Pyruvate/2-oxoacid:ferredoxin oxidoreductase gamma subunit
MTRQDGVLNIVVAGFPYHDICLIADVISEAAVAHGMNCSGMALSARDTFGIRPSSYCLRLGERAHAAYIPNGEGDILLGVEAGTAARFAAQLMGMHGTAIVNTWQYHPPFQVPYPTVDEIIDLLDALLARVIQVDAVSLAERAGDKRLAYGLVDCAMLGSLAGSDLLPFRAPEMERALASKCRPDEAERMLGSFQLGIEAVRTSQRTRTMVASH